MQKQMRLDSLVFNATKKMTILLYNDIRHPKIIPKNDRH